MSNDTNLTVNAICSCATKANIPQLDRQQTSVSASTTAYLVKQRSPYLAKAPLFQSGHHTFYKPVAGLVTPWDTWVEALSWSQPGGLDEVVEVADASGVTIFRGVAQALDDSGFRYVQIAKFARGGYTIPVLDSGRLDVFVGRPLRNAVR